MESVKVKTTKPWLVVRILSETSSGIHPIYQPCYERKIRNSASAEELLKVAKDSLALEEQNK